MHSKTRRVSESGFSLIELMIVMIVMSVIMGAVFTLMNSSLKLSNTTYELTDTRENVRIAHEYINRDIINAGYQLNDYDKIQVPEGFVTDYLAKNLVPDAAKTGYVNLGIVSSDLKPGAVAVKDSSPAVNVLADTDRITILKLDPSFAAISIASGKITGYGATITMSSDDGKRLKVGEIYFFTSPTNTAFGRVTAVSTVDTTSTVSFGTANSFGLNKTVAAGPINLVGAGDATGKSTQTVSIRRAYITHYYVNSKHELVKREFGVAGVGFTDNLVAEHIKGLSFRYILGVNNANGTVQQPVYQLTSWAQQDAVRQIEITITGETTHPINIQTDQSGNHIENRGEDKLTVISSARNLQFRRAQKPKKP
jgi:prepilin-type N-terminal cleavage/methylation domain-containing protein